MRLRQFAQVDVPKEFIKKLALPRKVVILVQAGKADDAAIAVLTEHMEEGDIIVDGENEWYPNLIHRSEQLEKKGIMFVGMGISGGKEGTRDSPSLMPSGPKEAYDELENILTSCAAQVRDGPCTVYIGPVGSRNYVKMIHNGIKYGDMQFIAEVYDIMSNEEMAEVFTEWNKGELESYLVEMIALILAKKDDINAEGYVVDYVLDKTSTKGAWTVQETAEQSVAAAIISGSLDACFLSGRKSERTYASPCLDDPCQGAMVYRDQIVIRAPLRLSFFHIFLPCQCAHAALSLIHI